MRTLIVIVALCFTFSANAQYVKNGKTITTEDLNLKAQQLTQQCVYLHIAAVGSTVLGIVLIGVAATNISGGGYGGRRTANSGAGLATAGLLCFVGGGVCGILEWIKVSQAHNILSLGNPKVSFNSGAYGMGVAYNF